MNQKLSWALLVSGGALFLYQLGDLLATHSAWADVFQPAGVGEILRTLGGAALAVLGALGVRLQSATDTTAKASTSTSSKANKLTGIVLAVALTGGAGSACALLKAPAAGPITPSPSTEQIQKTREWAIRIADGTTIALNMATQAVQGADALQRAGLISAGTLRALAQGLVVFSTAADRALVELGSVTTTPSLLATTGALLRNLDPLLDAMERSGNDGLRQTAGYLRIATAVARTFTATGGA